jgi:hypothetical protein
LAVVFPETHIVPVNSAGFKNSIELTTPQNACASRATAR